MKHKISQVTLAHYLSLFAQEKETRAVRKGLQDQITAMLRGGAAVEAGPIEARLIEYTSVNFTKANLIAAIGQQRFELLRSKVEPTPHSRLRIAKHKEGTNSKANKKQDAVCQDFVEDEWQ
jgi:hypothetical protein